MEKFILMDYDGDGVQDIVILGYQDFFMQWLKGQGNGDFLFFLFILNVVIVVWGFELVDMDGDGDLDMVGSVEIFLNGGIDCIIVFYNLANDVGVFGQVFFDINVNGQCDIQEVFFDCFLIMIEFEVLVVFIDEEGWFIVYGVEGIYNISFQFEVCWILIIIFGSYEIIFDGMFIDSLEFGVSLNIEEFEVGIMLVFVFICCGFIVFFWFNYINDGCWLLDGQAYLVFNELAELVEVMFVFVQLLGDILFWDFEGLQLGES